MLYYIREVNGSIIGLKYNNSIYYYIKNAQEDVIGILDSNLQQIVSYEYDSWGNVISIKDENNQDITDSTHIGIINPYRYRSYYFDKETNLYYLNSRYYNPVWGRFLNADGIIGASLDLLGYNLYIYCSNNQILFSDNNGNWQILSIITMVNKAVRSIVKLVKSVINSKTKTAKTSATTPKPTTSSGSASKNSVPVKESKKPTTGEQATVNIGLSGSKLGTGVGISYGETFAPSMGIDRAYVALIGSLDFTLGAPISVSLTYGYDKNAEYSSIQNGWQNPEISCGALIFYNFQANTWTLSPGIGCYVDWSYVVEWDR
jgi:RHS repeat-associated protein